MKTLLFIGIAILMPLYPICAQLTAGLHPMEQEFRSDRTQAYFPNLKSYARANLKYPIAALESQVQGRVEATALIQPNGSVQDVKIVRGISWSCDRAVEKMIKNMPAWIPATQNGSPVAQTVDITVAFKLKT